MKTLTTTLTTIALIALFIVVVTKIHLPKENNNQSATALTATEIKAKIADLKAQLTTTPTLTTYTRNLTIGSKGTDVLALQKYLKANGYLTIATPTTYFGTLTRAALAKWQKARNISPPAGYFGTISRAALNTSPTNNNTAIQLQIDALNQQLAAIPTTTTTTTTTVRTDFTPPTLSAGIPTGTLSSSTSSTTLGITTNEASTCKFSQNFNPYESMESTFEVTGGTTHTSTISNLSNGHSYTFHVECKDTAGTVTPNDYTISFSVDGVALGTGGSPIVTSSNTVDTTPPVRSAGSPGGTLNAGTTQTTLSLTTNEVATCKYATTSIPYLSMTSFTNTVSTTHTTIITGLTNSASYTYYVRCKDTANNTNTDDFNISFSVAAQGTPPDTTPPAAPGTPDMTSATDSGTSSTDNLTNDTTPDFTLSCESGATVTLKEASTTLGTGTCSSSTVTITSSTLSSGAHSIKAHQTDQASNVSTDSSTLSITIDATIPTLSSGAPTGSLASSTTTTNLTLTSSETATCKYSTTASTPYSSMLNTFSTTNSTSHSQSISVTSGTSYSYYVRCSDSSANISSELTISFSVASAGGGGGGVAYSGTVLNGSSQVSGGVVQVLNGSNVVATGAISSGAYSIPMGSLSGSYTLKLQPALQYSLGAGEPDTVTNLAVGSTRNFTVQNSWYSDDFQSYSTTNDITGACTGGIQPGEFFYGVNHDVPGCYNTGQIFLDNGGPNGGKAVRYDWPARPTGGDYSVYLQGRFNPPPIMSDVWIRWTSKESLGFAHGGNGATGSANQYKFFKIQIDNIDSGAEFGTFLDNTASGLGVDPTTISVLSTDALGHSSTHPGYNLGSSWSGQYHTWVAKITGLGTSSAVMTIYMDGNPVVSTPPTPYKPGQTVGGPGWIMVLQMGANINNGPDATQSRWFSDLGVYTTRPSLIIQ